MPRETASLLLKGRYRLGTLIGQGGVAAVYRAHDLSLGRDVAVKVFRENADAEATFATQEAEVNLLAALGHPGLVTLLDAAVDRSPAGSTRIYYVMELVDGQDLRARLEQGPLPARQTALLAADIAETLVYLHNRGIVHRDIKPANILLTDGQDDGRVRAKLTDFGIATLGGSDPLARGELVNGTVAYLSPEQAGGGAVDAATDIYSLGLVMLQCVTGRLPFEGPAEHSALERQLRDPSIPAELPPELRDLLIAMTHREPAQRPPATEVLRTLYHWLASDRGRHALDWHSERLGRAAYLVARALGTAAAVVTMRDGGETVTGSHGLAGAGLIGAGPGDHDPVALVDAAAAAAAGFRFHQTAPVVDETGAVIGVVVVLDVVQREYLPGDRETLEAIAALVAV